jgi:hypothetical protein
VEVTDDEIKKPMSIKDIAKKHGVSEKDIKKEIDMGTDIEFEHIKNQNQKEDRELAKTIATHHVQEFHDYYSNPEHGLIASEKELEEEYAGSFVGPLGGSPIKRSVYGESKTIRMADLLKEVNTLDTKLRDGGSFDGNAWVGDKNDDGWTFNDHPTFHEDGEIVDILAKLDIDWKDEDLTVLTKESIMESIDEVAGKEVHTEKWKSCFEKVKEQGKSEESAAAICTDSIGYEGSIKKAHRQKEGLTEAQLLDEGVSDFIMNMSNKVKQTYSKNKDLVLNFVKNQKESIKKIREFKQLVEQKYKSGEISEEDYEKAKAKITKQTKILLKNILKIVGPASIPTGLVIRGLIAALSKNKIGKKLGIDKLNELLTPEILDLDALELLKSHDSSGNPKLSVKDDDEEQIEETTTFGSVWGGDGPPVGKIFASKGKTSSAGKKAVYDGGTIVQSLPNSGVLTKESVIDEINKVKYNKGGKYVKLKGRCVKYRNQPFCSAGDADKPVILSNTTSDNIDEVSRKTGIPKEKIFEAIINKFSN